MDPTFVDSKKGCGLCFPFQFSLNINHVGVTYHKSRKLYPMIHPLQFPSEKTKQSEYTRCPFSGTPPPPPPAATSASEAMPRGGDHGKGREPPMPNQPIPQTKERRPAGTCMGRGLLSCNHGNWSSKDCGGEFCHRPKGENCKHTEFPELANGLGGKQGPATGLLFPQKKHQPTHGNAIQAVKKSCGISGSSQNILNSVPGALGQSVAGQQKPPHTLYAPPVAGAIHPNCAG